MDTDFKNRTVLHLITYNNFAPLMSDSKVAALLDELWVGKLSYECDGKTENFSKLKYMATSNLRRLPSMPIKISQVLGDEFKPDITEPNFSIQYKFRRKSIATLFQKNFISACAQVFCYQYINYQFLILFKKSVILNEGYQANLKVTQLVGGKITYLCADILKKISIDGPDCPGQEAINLFLEENFATFRSFCNFGIFVTISSLISVICTFAFNSRSVYKVPFDKWSAMDLFQAVVNVCVLQSFRSFKPEDFLDDTKREVLTYLNLAMVVVSWARFLSFFFVISSISKLLMTLGKMITAAATFLFITFCYLIMLMPIYGTLYQSEAINYVSPIYVLLALWDALITGGGVHFDKGEYKMENDIWNLAHVLFANVILLNYLIAILATVYEDMLAVGDFAYKSNKYMYIERYYIPMQDKWGYTELVTHPPPMNYISVLLLAAMFNNTTMLKASEGVALVIFWLENIYYMFAMFLEELILLPICYFKLSMSILKAPFVWNKVQLLLFWIPFGPWFLTYYLLNDMYFFSKILCDYRLEDEDGIAKREEDEIEDKVVIYNEVLDTLRAVHNTLKYNKRKRMKEHEKGKSSPPKSPLGSPKTGKLKDDKNPLKMQSDKYDLVDELQREAEDDKPDEGYTIEKDLIVDAWKRFRPVNKIEEEVDDVQSRHSGGTNLTRNRVKPRTATFEISEIFGKLFKHTLMSSFTLVLYDFTEQED